MSYFDYFKVCKKEITKKKTIKTDLENEFKSLK